MAPEYIKRIRITQPMSSRDTYPYSIPLIKNLEEFELTHNVTFIIGENGHGKSTLIEALAIKAGFNPEGGSMNFRFSTLDTHSKLYQAVEIDYERKPQDGYFIRGETLYHLAAQITRLYSHTEEDYKRLIRNYGAPPEEQSHGESVMAIVHGRLERGTGLYIFDEPETGLSLMSQLSLLGSFKRMARHGAQLIIATHSPFLLSFPGADIVEIKDGKLRRVRYEETDMYRLSRLFFKNYRMLTDEL